MCPNQAPSPCEGLQYPVWIQWKPCSFSGRNTTRMSSSPITNTGIDRPISTANVENLSNRLRALVALMMPTVSPAISQCACRACSR